MTGEILLPALTSASENIAEKAAALAMIVARPRCAIRCLEATTIQTSLIACKTLVKPLLILSKQKV